MGYPRNQDQAVCRQQTLSICETETVSPWGVGLFLKDPEHMERAPAAAPRLMFFVG